MALQVTAELEDRIGHIATEVQRSPNDLMLSAMQEFVEDCEEQLAAVKEADAQFDCGEFLPHEEVVALFRRRFAKS